MTIEEAMEGLKQGKTLCVDRRDCPILPDLLKLSGEGVLTNQLIEVDEQYSVLKFKLNTCKP